MTEFCIPNCSFHFRPQYKERVFLSNQIHKSTMEPLQKLWTGQDSIIAIICQAKVIRSFRLRGNITPSSIRILAQIYTAITTPTVLFIPTQHGKRMFLADKVEIFDSIDMLGQGPSLFDFFE